MTQKWTRRQAIRAISATAAVPLLAPHIASAANKLSLEYIVASSMYGKLPLADVLAQVPKTDSNLIDIWPHVHANHREQIEEMGHEKFMALLAENNVRLGMLTHYDLGPFKLRKEMEVGRKFAGKGQRLVIICGSSGPKNLEGAELKKAVAVFVEKLKPELEVAAKHDVEIGIENHANALIASPDSLRYFADATTDMPHVGIAFAPYHLPQDAEFLGELLTEVGHKVNHYYAWQHHHYTSDPKENEIDQMPGRGPLDFTPMLRALAKVNYAGWTSAFMHPTPRGIPILPKIEEVTSEINRAQDYLENCAEKI